MDNQLMFDLIKSEVIGCAWQTNISEISFDQIKSMYGISKKHDISQIVYASLKRNNLIPTVSSFDEEQCLKEFGYNYAYSVYHSNKMCREIKNISKALNRAGIKHVFLKGAVLRNIYAQKWMRTSGDIDCLVPKEKISESVEVLKTIGYTFEDKTRFHDVELKKADTTLELHFSICEGIHSLDKVLKRVWNNVEPTSEYMMKEKNDFFVFHHMAHIAYHISNGGCGIRPLIDLLVINKYLPYDEDKVKKLCKDAGIIKLYNLANRLVRIWFEGEPHNNETLQFEQYIIDSATFGTEESKQQMSDINRMKIKKHIFRHIFLPFNILKEIYPALNRHPLLFPFYEIYHPIKKIFDKKQRERLNCIINTDEKDMNPQALDILRISGLNEIL